MSASHALGRHLALAGLHGRGEDHARPGAGDAARPSLRGRGRRARRSVTACLPASSSERAARRRSASSRRRRQPTCSQRVRRPWSRSAAARCSAEGTRRALAERAFTVHVEVDTDEAWRRARQAGDRPLADDEERFRRSLRRAPPRVSRGPGCGRPSGDADGVVLAAAGVHVEQGALERLRELVPGTHGSPWSPTLASPASTASRRSSPSARGSRTPTSCRPGEDAKAPPQLEARSASWRSAATARSSRWAAARSPTSPGSRPRRTCAASPGRPCPRPSSARWTLPSAARPRSTSRGQEPRRRLPLARAHVVDPGLLATLPERERANGLAEVVKTGLLAGEPLWELPVPERVRACAAFKAAVCLRDPHERGERAASTSVTRSRMRSKRPRATPAGARRRRRARPARRPSLSGQDALTGRAAARAAPGSRRPRAGVGGARPRQEGGRRPHPARAARRAGPSAPGGRRARGRRASRARLPDRRLDARRASRVAADADRRPERRQPRRHSAGAIRPSTAACRSHELESRIYRWSRELGLPVRCRQTNHEGEFVGCSTTPSTGPTALIANPGAWTHYSFAIRDALELVRAPVVEVHLSNLDEREAWRRDSVLADVVSARFIGKGPDGYREALEWLAERSEPCASSGCGSGSRSRCSSPTRSTSSTCPASRARTPRFSSSPSACACSPTSATARRRVTPRASSSRSCRATSTAGLPRS